VPLDVVIEFKREVYQRALQELSRFLSRPPHFTQKRNGQRLPVSPAAASDPMPEAPCMETADPDQESKQE